MNWSEFKQEAMTFIKKTFGDKVEEYAAGVWSIAVPIIENVSKIDLNNDGVVKHYKEEILAIARDEAIQFGDDLTEGLIESAQGGLLKRLIATSQIAKIICTMTPVGNIPGGEWLVNYILEQVVGMMKSGLIKLDDKIDDWVEQTEQLYKAEMAGLVKELCDRTGYMVSGEHFWGTDTFTIFVLQDENDTKPEVLKGSMNALLVNKQHDYEKYLETFVQRIKALY